MATLLRAYLSKEQNPAMLLKIYSEEILKAREAYVQSFITPSIYDEQIEEAKKYEVLIRELKDFYRTLTYKLKIGEEKLVRERIPFTEEAEERTVPHGKEKLSPTEHERETQRGEKELFIRDLIEILDLDHKWIVDEDSETVVEIREPIPNLDDIEAIENWLDEQIESWIKYSKEAREKKGEAIEKYKEIQDKSRSTLLTDVKEVLEIGIGELEIQKKSEVEKAKGFTMNSKAAKEFYEWIDRQLGVDRKKEKVKRRMATTELEQLIRTDEYQKRQRNAKKEVSENDKKEAVKSSKVVQRLSNRLDVAKKELEAANSQIKDGETNYTKPPEIESLLYGSKFEYPKEKEYEPMETVGQERGNYLSLLSFLRGQPSERKFEMSGKEFELLQDIVGGKEFDLERMPDERRRDTQQGMKALQDILNEDIFTEDKPKTGKGEKLSPQSIKNWEYRKVAKSIKDIEKLRNLVESSPAFGLMGIPIRNRLLDSLDKFLVKTRKKIEFTKPEEIAALEKPKGLKGETLEEIVTGTPSKVRWPTKEDWERYYETTEKQGDRNTKLNRVIELTTKFKDNIEQSEYIDFESKVSFDPVTKTIQKNIYKEAKRVINDLKFGYKGYSQYTPDDLIQEIMEGDFIDEHRNRQGREIKRLHKARTQLLRDSGEVEGEETIELPPELREALNTMQEGLHLEEEVHRGFHRRDLEEAIESLDNTIESLRSSPFEDARKLERVLTDETTLVTDNTAKRMKVGEILFDVKDMGQRIRTLRSPKERRKAQSFLRENSPKDTRKKVVKLSEKIEELEAREEQTDEDKNAISEAEKELESLSPRKIIEQKIKNIERDIARTKKDVNEAEGPEQDKLESKLDKLERELSDGHEQTAFYDEMEELRRERIK